MTLLVLFAIIVNLLNFITTQNMSGHIVNGTISRIEDFPHSAHLYITCRNDNTGCSICGSSILTNLLLLTAAHCVDDCNEKSNIIAYTGNVRRRAGLATKIIDFKVHEKFNRYDLYRNDIAILVLQNNLTFGTQVKRVALLKLPPFYDRAMIAGWGKQDEQGTTSNVLQNTSQIVMSREQCMKKIGKLPVGTICGSDPKNRHPSHGDSGSALIVRGFIQIGIVSVHRRSHLEIEVYTDVPYFYDWIRQTAKDLYRRNFCSSKILWVI